MNCGICITYHYISINKVSPIIPSVSSCKEIHFCINRDAIISSVLWCCYMGNKMNGWIWKSPNIFQILSNLLFLGQQRQQDALTKANCCMEQHIMGSMSHAKVPTQLWRVSVGALNPTSIKLAVCGKDEDSIHGSLHAKFPHSRWNMCVRQPETSNSGMCTYPASFASTQVLLTVSSFWTEKFILWHVNNATPAISKPWPSATLDKCEKWLVTIPTWCTS